MVLPEQFHVATESLEDNIYLQPEQAVDPERALQQSQALAEAVRAVGVPVHCFAGRAGQPDGVFPNNVFATVPGKLIVGSMYHDGRRAEAERADIRAYFLNTGQRELVDLSQQGCVAELTGPLVIDRARGVGLCGLSTRVDKPGLTLMHRAFDLKLTLGFKLQANEYHTNVVLAILASRAMVAYAGALRDDAVVEVLSRLYPQSTLWLSGAEKDAFVANCIAVTDQDLFLSQTALSALRPGSRKKLQSWGFRLHSIAVDELEKAGGSLRCMLAEVF